jgi:hypothetical protein
VNFYFQRSLDSVYAFLTASFTAAMYKSPSFSVRPGSVAEHEKVTSEQAKERLLPVLVRAGPGVTKRMFEIMLTAPQRWDECISSVVSYSVLSMILSSTCSPSCGSLLSRVRVLSLLTSGFSKACP